MTYLADRIMESPRHAHLLVAPTHGRVPVIEASAVAERVDDPPAALHHGGAGLAAFAPPAAHFFVELDRSSLVSGDPFEHARALP